MIYTSFISTPIGIMAASANVEAIISLDFTEEAQLPFEGMDHPLLLRLKTELKEYFAGNRSVFTLPLHPEGTPFQKEVWRTLLCIPYGKTISYAEEAKKFGNPKAVRAVANANGRNPISILIPCHRVIASNGMLGGYSGGVLRKEFLLRLESKKGSR